MNESKLRCSRCSVDIVDPCGLQKVKYDRKYFVLFIVIDFMSIVMVSIAYLSSLTPFSGPDYADYALIMPVVIWHNQIVSKAATRLSLSEL